MLEVARMEHPLGYDANDSGCDRLEACRDVQALHS